ncbi:hypothetical protein UPYG_G00172710 [Umbra pygmaea]|uniref:Uncharacterized protein n=1 Tax=Umbra pygmaea TaxID=75934 RepID=A0ABD0WTX0_UMBPY
MHVLQRAVSSGLGAGSGTQTTSRGDWEAERLGLDSRCVIQRTGCVILRGHRAAQLGDLGPRTLSEHLKTFGKEDWADSRQYQALSTLGPLPNSKEDTPGQPMHRPHTVKPPSAQGCQLGSVGRPVDAEPPRLSLTSHQPIGKPQPEGLAGG